ncbi:hypothetical protein X975_15402, partial [Stegodyphus mimosarum]
MTTDLSQILSSKRVSQLSPTDAISEYKRAKLNRNEEEEINFLRLFWEALDNFCKVADISETHIQQAIDNIIASFRYSKGGRFENINLSFAENICGYIHRYSSLGAGLARNRVLEAIDNCEALNCCLNFADINVISLGAGPGNDVIGFCSAFYERTVCLTLNLTLVDSAKRWSSCFNITEFLTRERNFGNASNLFKETDVTTVYMRVDLPGNLVQDSKYFTALSEADIIIMQKLLSIIPLETKKSLIKSVAETMKEEAVLLFIDSPFPEYCFKDFDIIYQSAIEEYIFPVSERKFGRSNAVFSTARLVVLMKKHEKNE